MTTIKLGLKIGCRVSLDSADSALGSARMGLCGKIIFAPVTEWRSVQLHTSGACVMLIHCSCRHADIGMHVGVPPPHHQQRGGWRWAWCSRLRRSLARVRLHRICLSDTRHVHRSSPRGVGPVSLGGLAYLFGWSRTGFHTSAWYETEGRDEMREPGPNVIPGLWVLSYARAIAQPQGAQLVVSGGMDGMVCYSYRGRGGGGGGEYRYRR